MYKQHLTYCEEKKSFYINRCNLCINILIDCTSETLNKHKSMSVFLANIIRNGNILLGIFKLNILIRQQYAYKFKKKLKFSKI